MEEIFGETWTHEGLHPNEGKTEIMIKRCSNKKGERERKRHKKKLEGSDCGALLVRD